MDIPEINEIKKLVLEISNKEQVSDAEIKVRNIFNAQTIIHASKTLNHNSMLILWMWLIKMIRFVRIADGGSREVSSYHLYGQIFKERDSNVVSSFREAALNSDSKLVSINLIA